MSFAIKLYIRRMLALAGLDTAPKLSTSARKHTEYSVHAKLPAKTVIIRQYQTVTGPVRHSMFELVQNLKASKAIGEAGMIIISFLVRNRLFVVFLVVVIALCVAAVWFFSDVNTKSRPYDVGIVNPDSTVVISSDEILYRSLPKYELPDGEEKVEQPEFSIELVNSSGEPGLAAKAKRKLEAYGYDVGGITNELNRSDAKSVVIFNPNNQEAALTLSKKLNGALLSVDAEISPEIVRVYIGTDNR
jgi:hypothetical protein